MGVKTARHDEFVLEHEIRDALGRFGAVDASLQGLSLGRGYIGRWFAPRAVRELLAFRSIVTDYQHADVLRPGPTGVTSTSGSAVRSTAPITSSGATAAGRDGVSRTFSARGSSARGRRRRPVRSGPVASAAW